MPLTVAELMSKMPGAFIPEKAPGLDAVIQFKFTGANWRLVCHIKEARWVAGVHETPNDLTADPVTMSKFSLANRWDAGFMQGKLKLAGDLNLAMKLTQMFKIR
jgi:hypothetical protein